jgi:hypothetical protein
VQLLKLFTPAEQQAEALETFIANNEYLNSRRGTYAERNGGEFPWFTRVNLAVIQDVTFKIGGKKNGFQIRLDMINFGNLLNNKWGVGWTTTTN